MLLDLKLPIARPPWTSLGKELESCVRKAIYDFDLFDGVPEKVAIALSGGKDSLTLLFLLHSLRGRGFPLFEIHAIHVDGEFSCGAGVQGDFLRAICREMEINFISCTSTQKREDLECYSCSRERSKFELGTDSFKRYFCRHDRYFEILKVLFDYFSKTRGDKMTMNTYEEYAGGDVCPLLAYLLFLDKEVVPG